MDLIKSKSYGTVHGDGLDHVYEQDGKFFDGQGMEMGKEKVPHIAANAQKADNAQKEVPTVYNKLTIADIKAQLDGLGIEYDEDAKKNELYKLMKG